MKEIYFLVIYFISVGILSPSFEDFSYFFLLNVIGVSKLLFAVLVLVGQICQIVGALIYKAYCRQVDTRWMIFFGMCAGVLQAFFNYAFAKRWNLQWGIPDKVFLFVTDPVMSVVSTILYVLPLLSLFAKVTPPRIEGTIFAFLTGTWNLSRTVISPGMGSFINHQFVGVNKNDLSQYPTLCLIALLFSLVLFPLLFLIPTKRQLKEWKIVRD